MFSFHWSEKLWRYESKINPNLKIDKCIKKKYYDFACSVLP